MVTTYLERLKGSGLLADALCSFVIYWYNGESQNHPKWGATPTDELDEYSEQTYELLPYDEIPTELKVWYNITEEFRLPQGSFFTRPTCYPKGFYDGDLGHRYDQLPGDGFYRIFGKFAGDANDDCGPYVAIHKDHDGIWRCFSSNHAEDKWLPMKTELDEFLTEAFLWSIADSEYSVADSGAICYSSEEGLIEAEFSNELLNNSLTVNHFFNGSNELNRLSVDPVLNEHATKVRGYPLWAHDPEYYLCKEFGLLLTRIRGKWRSIGVKTSSRFYLNKTVD